jgi:hypothetical protein
MTYSSFTPLWFSYQFLVNFLDYHPYAEMSVYNFYCHNLISRNSNSRDIINIISLCVILISALTVTHGQRSNFIISLPVSGLPFSLLTPHLSPRSFLRKLYKGESGEYYCLPASLLSPPPPLLLTLRPSELLHSPHAQPAPMRNP